MGPSSKRLAVARDLGADVTIDMSSQQAKTPEDRVRLVFDSTEGHGADVIIDTSGIPGAIDEGLRMARPGGKYLVMGQATDYGTSPINTTLIMRKQLRIFGSFSGLPKHLHKAILELERADIPVDKLVTHRFHLDEATTGLEAVDRFESIFAVLEYR